MSERKPKNDHANEPPHGHRDRDSSHELPPKRAADPLPAAMIPILPGLKRMRWADLIAMGRVLTEANK